ncbi:Xaa-Pro aminopeptidase [Acidisarcina polymorpha]|uniref:Xaa-Pro aminopeptidase n=2 Tax=Acidisarcina polymorpha TaxID=2211140 RepID=A0A2Z5G2C2_9BACT|nr:Xaa-Pro aminopeptidase [Acidisarcina polymorpha]
MRHIYFWVFLLATGLNAATGSALDRQPAAIYHARREALAEKLEGGVAILFAANEPALEYQQYRQDEDFYYLTGWNEPGAALLIESPVAAHDRASARGYREVMLLPIRNLRMERYTGVKLDAASAGAANRIGIDEVRSMADLPGILIEDLGKDPRALSGIWSQTDVPQAKPALAWAAVTLGAADAPAFLDVRRPVAELRASKDNGELELVRKATDASIQAQLAMIHAVKPGASERAITGLLIQKMLGGGCERPSYPPIVASGSNSTVLHYSASENILKSGDVVVVDAAGEFSMYASDITRTVPVGGRFTDRQREIYNIVLGAQRAAEAAFVAGKSRENDPLHKYADSLDTIAWKYMNEHGKDLHGEPLGKYFIHGIGHLVGIDVHDPFDYTKPLGQKMIFTIEPGIYIPEEKIGIRIEDIYYADDQGKLIQLTQKLPHTADEIEAEMKSGSPGAPASE